METSTEKDPKSIVKEESYAERRALFRGIWDAAAAGAALAGPARDGSPEDPFAGKSKVIKTARLEDEKSEGRRKRQRIKNLRSVCNKILDFCNRQERDMYDAQEFNQSKESQAEMENNLQLKSTETKEETPKKHRRKEFPGSTAKLLPTKRRHKPHLSKIAKKPKNNSNMDELAIKEEFEAMQAIEGPALRISRSPLKINSKLLAGGSKRSPIKMRTYNSFKNRSVARKLNANST